MARTVAAAVASVVLVAVVLSSSWAQLAVAQVPTATAAQVDSCNNHCTDVCNAVGNAACPGNCFGNPPVNAELCSACKTGASNECYPQCTNVCYLNPDPSV
ncbi:hypothetical protein GQ55_8G259800 [Panicum hallii var. hallii]|uniref:Uncharacterized protein n=1 Tax=Panicum hallii var. hallii TaxID=1504633 RepID=A0A2T7CRC7_9POAL|nr:hypothetical protein GQ55_8G259800 [Panicum hallii var. hallii]